MKTVPLGRTGEQVSQLALGCMLMGTATDEESSVRMLDQYLDLGGSFLDTANCYAWWPRQGDRGGESEELLGRWFARGGRRDRVFLATKGAAGIRDVDAVWASGEADWALARRSFEGAGADTLRGAIDGSLRRLGTDHVDLYYVHFDDEATPLEETLEALAGIVAAGKARYIGWSNVRTWRLERIRNLCERYGWPVPVALQQQYSYLRPRPGLRDRSIVSDEQLEYLQAHDDLTLVAYSPILKGIYDDPVRRDGHWMWREAYVSADSLARIAAVREVADEVGATPNQVVLAWLMRQAAPALVPLIGPRTVGQFEAALPALDISLTDAHLARLADAGETAAEAAVTQS